MSKLTTADVLNKDVLELIIPADKVAHVQTINPLEHALLVLVKTGYSAVPVLDAAYKLKGVISKTMILNDIFGIERIEFEKLSERKVEQVMKADVPVLKSSDDLLTAIKLSIDQTFVNVEDEKGNFLGILQRSALLKFLNHYLRDQSHVMVSL
ncbi:cyclic-di-AMP-binding protein CbpB [Camelliibacillus cellulosilyticus]|uniref:Cyclic-di-AMP-binding protein CbpB n=1 Tax=Camelliibacillus cellulosilyticus TaxID=2174486 RepID=A0ABV9GIX3_9BACL